MEFILSPNNLSDWPPCYCNFLDRLHTDNGFSFTETSDKELKKYGGEFIPLNENGYARLVFKNKSSYHMFALKFG
jgi:hypothetical protein